MRRTYDATLTIDTLEGIMTCPAVYDVCEDYANLLTFTIGSRQFSLDDAIAMTGVDHVGTQELSVWKAWLDETESEWNLEAAE